MRRAAHTVLFRSGQIPLLGNLHTGAVIGLTEEGAQLCQALTERDVPEGEVPAACKQLVEHLVRGGYLAPDASAHDHVCDGQPTDATSATPTSTASQPLRSAYLHVTQRCNLACHFCYSEDERRNRLADPKLCDLQRAVDVLGTMGAHRLVISGGEPFLRGDLPDLARHAKQAGMNEVVVLTNGLLVTRERAEALVGLVDCVGVAFDGCSADDVAYLRGRQLFGQLTCTVHMLRALGLPVRIVPTLHGGNVSSMERYRQLAAELDATLSFSLLTAPTCELGSLALSNDQLTCLGRDAFASQTAVGGGTDGRGALSFAARVSCGAGTRTLSIAADGTVYPCHMLHDARLALGNAFSDKVADLEQRRTHSPWAKLCVDQLEGCVQCAHRYLCGGGCRARAWYDTQRLEAHDPSCALYRAYYDALGAELTRRFASQSPPT